VNIALDIALADIGAWGLAAIVAALLGLRIVAKQLRIAAPPKEAQAVPEPARSTP
jgi:hypothetical protein